MEKTKIVIYGSGGFGREVAAMIKYSGLKEKYQIEGFIDDGETKGKMINNIPILGNGNDLLYLMENNISVVMAIASPHLRKKLIQKFNGFPFPNIIHPSVKMHDRDNIAMGEGNLICDGNILTTNIEIGNYNIINLSCTIGHDAVIGDYCSLMPGVNLSGGTILKNEVYVGTGAKLIKRTTLGDGCIIGAGSVVNTDVPSGKTYVGVPAKEIPA